MTNSKHFTENSSYTALLLMIVALGSVWVRSGYGKFMGGKFIETLSPTLVKFSTNNPTSWYKDFLETIAIPNAIIFAHLTLWGEITAAITLVLCPLYLLWSRKRNTFIELGLLLGLATGMFLNFNFGFAAGWMSASTESLNMLMFLLELIGFIYVFRLLKHPAE